MYDDTGAGGERIADGTAVLAALERLPQWLEPVWTEVGFPVVDRSRHAIFPLAVAPLPDDAEPSRAEALRDAAVHLQNHGIHFYGGDFFHAESPLDLEAGYGRRLADAGPILLNPPRLIWWGIGKLAVVLVRAADPVRYLETLSLHVLPKEWVWRWPPEPSTKREASRARRMVREQTAADASWSWPLPDPGE